MSEAFGNPSEPRELSSPVVLSPTHDVSGFSCGEEELDRFVAQSALNRQKAMLSRTYVSLAEQQDQIAGYYTLAHVQLTASEMLSKMARGMPSSIPALLMARLAVDTRFQRRGLGESLFGDALLRAHAVIESRAAPVRFFLVDAKHQRAKAFYLKFGMKPLSDDSLRLYLSYKQIRAAIEAS